VTKAGNRSYLREGTVSARAGGHAVEEKVFENLCISQRPVELHRRPDGRDQISKPNPKQKRRSMSGVFLQLVRWPESKTGQQKLLFSTRFGLSGWLPLMSASRPEPPVAFGTNKVCYALAHRSLINNSS